VVWGKGRQKKSQNALMYDHRGLNYLPAVGKDTRGKGCEGGRGSGRQHDLKKSAINLDLLG